MNQPLEHYKIILIGDACIDKTHYGHVNRLSPEAPIPILDFKETIETGGMATNVKNNLENLFDDNKCTFEIFSYTEYHEIKNRYVDIKTKQQLLRLDERTEKVMVGGNWDNPAGLWGDLPEADIMIIADYDKGTVSYDMIKKLRANFNGPILLDTKKPDLAQFNGCILKINDKEWNARISDPGRLSDSIITYGGDKVVWQNVGFEHTFYPPKVETYDPCGCGDTFLAAVAYKYVQTKNMGIAIELGMDAAAETIKHIGVYAPTWKEIMNG